LTITTVFQETCTIDENVLEQRSQSTSCILSLKLNQSSQIVFVLICETQTHTHTHTHILKRSEMSLSLSFLLIVVFLDLKHTQIERALKRFVKCCNSNEVDTQSLFDYLFFVYVVLLNE
jgi:hypothetical protein